MYLVSVKQGIGVKIFVQPKASKTRIVGVYDDMVKIAVAAPPVEGKANKKVISFMAGLFQVRKSDVKIVTGEHSRRKVCLIAGQDEERLRTVLGPFL